MMDILTESIEQESDVQESDLTKELWPGSKLATDSRGANTSSLEIQNNDKIADYRNRLENTFNSNELDSGELIQFFSSEALPLFKEITDGFHLAENQFDLTDGVHFAESYGLFPEYCTAVEEVVDPFFQKLEKHIEGKSSSEKDLILQNTVSYFKKVGKENFDNLPLVSSSCRFLIQEDGDNSLLYVKDLYHSFKNAHGPTEWELWGDERPNLYSYNENKYFDLEREITNSLYQSIKTISSQDKINFLSDFFPETSGLVHPYVRIINDLGPEKFSGRLIQDLKSESLKISRTSAEVLFGLELGKIGITEKGVEYLGKLYDLGKYNDPDFFVRRLNCSGMVGVLSGSGNVEGVFPLDLFSKQDLVHAEVRQLISQELFLPKADETILQRQQREEYLKLFLENYEDIFKNDFFNDLDFKLNSLELYEQGWFVLYYLELMNVGDRKGVDELKKFVKKYGEYGLKSFLALDYCEKPDSIIEFAQCKDITEENKLRVFEIFSKTERLSNNYCDIFSQLMPKELQNFGIQLHEAFIRNSSEFLQAAIMIGRGEEKEVTVQELIRGMEDIAKTMISFEHILQSSPDITLVGKPQKDSEYSTDGKKKKDASTSFVFYDKTINTRTTVFIRSEPTIKLGNSYGGEARINIHTAHLDRDGKVLRESRNAIDLSDYGEYVGKPDKKPVLSLDFCLDPDKPELRGKVDEISRLLKSVPTYQGHHNENSFSNDLPEHFDGIANSLLYYLERKYPKK